VKHLGLSAAPKVSTLAYANQHRPWQVYETVFHTLLGRCRQEARGRKRKFRFKHKLLSLDSTLIELCLAVFDWAVYQRAKGAIKLHLVLDHDGYLPTYAVLSHGKQADITVAKSMPFPAGAMLVFDRGYTDYDWWLGLTQNKVQFVTRLRDDASYGVVEQREVPAGSEILFDDVILLTAQQELGPQARLRRVEVWVEERNESMVLLTNNLTLSARTIAAIYRERWQIELFFKAIKRSLKIKTFVGTSENAVQIQIWTALIAMLLVKYLQLRSSDGWSLSNLIALLRQQLFVYRDLMSWLDEPFEEPPELTAASELQLALEFPR